TRKRRNARRRTSLLHLDVAWSHRVCLRRQRISDRPLQETCHRQKRLNSEVSCLSQRCLSSGRFFLRLYCSREASFFEGSEPSTTVIPAQAGIQMAKRPGMKKNNPQQVYGPF